MTESAMPANSMGSGENISTYDPLLNKKPVKRLRQIIGPVEKKGVNNGV